MTASGQNGGSILSRYGIGDLSSGMTARQRGLGGIVTPLSSEQDINQINPAAWTTVQGLRLQGDLHYEFEDYSKNSNLSIGSTGISGLQFCIPVQEELRSRIVFGFVPYSRVGYNLQGKGQTLEDKYTVDYVGSGGLSLIRLGSAIRPLPFLNIGAAAQFFFGNINQEWDVAFESGDRFFSKQSRSTNYHGLGFTLGTQVTVGDNFQIGIAYEPKVTLSGSQDLRFQYITHDSTMDGASGELEVPSRISAGATYFVSSQLMLGADIQMQDWKNAKIFDGPQAELGRSMRIGAGLEWVPGRDEFQGGFWRRAAYRVGVYSRENYARLNGVSENEFFLTLGMGIPIHAQNRADVAVEYGWRGSEDSLLGKRTLLRLSLSLSVGESWFVRRGQE